jgi:hypothetical protein
VGPIDTRTLLGNGVQPDNCLYTLTTWNATEIMFFPFHQNTRQDLIAKPSCAKDRLLLTINELRQEKKNDSKYQGAHD